MRRIRRRAVACASSLSPVFVLHAQRTTDLLAELRIIKRLEGPVNSSFCVCSRRSTARESSWPSAAASSRPVLIELSRSWTSHDLLGVQVGAAAGRSASGLGGCGGHGGHGGQARQDADKESAPDRLPSRSRRKRGASLSLSGLPSPWRSTDRSRAPSSSAARGRPRAQQRAPAEGWSRSSRSRPASQRGPTSSRGRQQ